MKTLQQNLLPPTGRIATLAGISATADDIVAIYPYGSRVYGTNSHSSDYDYIVILDDRVDYRKDAQQYDSRDKQLSVHTYLESSWEAHLANHKIFALECHSLFTLDHLDFTLDLPTLRKEISSKSSNSWVKAKKKLTVEVGEEYIGIKSLFHSFRIPIFGIQIAEHGKVIDFSAANHIWDELKNVDLSTITWEELHTEYKPRHNALMSEFRTYAEKA